MKRSAIRNLSPVFLTPCLALALGACGGRKVVPSPAAELAIPPDLAKAFEVQELPPVTPPSPLSTPTAVVAPGKREAKAEKKPKRKTRVQVKTETGVEGIAGPGDMNFRIPYRRANPDPVWVGEKIWMDVTWLGTKAGEFLLEVLPFKVMNGRKVYDLKGWARTSDLFSLIYRAEDWVESFVDYEGWFPYKFILHGDETKHIRNNLELFDHGARKQYVHAHDLRLQKNEVHEEKGFKELTPLSQDSLSALYYARTQKMEDGAVIRFPMTTNGSQWETQLTVLGREEVSTKMGYLKSFKTRIETRFKGVLQQQGDAFLWFSDDERKYPLRFEAKVRIGWVAGIARQIEPGAPEQAVQAVPSKSEQPKAPDADARLKSRNFVFPRNVVAGPTGDPPQAANDAENPAKRRMWFHYLLDSFGKEN